jgi:hypothetical protein
VQSSAKTASRCDLLFSENELLNASKKYVEVCIFYSPVVVKQGGAVAQVFLLSLVWLLRWSQ